MTYIENSFPNKTPLISILNAGIQRNQRWLIKDISLHLYRGDILTLIGPNGSGKSTTAKMALGLLKPSIGTVQYHSDIRVGYVPQKLNISPTLPLNVERFMHLIYNASAEQVNSALEATGAAHLSQFEIQKLSGGEFQRVLLARAIMQKPNVLVLDEPVQGVDFAGEIALYELIATIKDTLNCGILLISHDLHVVMSQSSHVICLNGRVCCQGKPEDIVQNESYRKLFGRHASTLGFYQHK